MEHRYSKRIATDIKVLIYKAGLPVAIGRLGDIGKQGMFVACQSADFALHQPLDIELLMQQKPSGGNFRYKCYLIHKRNGGLGLAVHEDYLTDYSAHTAALAGQGYRHVARGAAPQESLHTGPLPSTEAPDQDAIDRSSAVSKR